jgi:RimJ/RimL family protein N-acetyltransferase
MLNKDQFITGGTSADKYLQLAGLVNLSGSRIDRMDTHRLRLRRLSESDLKNFHEIWSNEIATRWSSSGSKKSLEESKTWMDGLLPANNPGGDNYAVFVRQEEIMTSNCPLSKGISSTVERDERMIGVVGVFHFSPVAELGYIFHHDVWGRGYATESVEAFLSIYWKSRSAVNAVQAKTDAENESSIWVLRKCGFREVARLPGNIILPTMCLRDSIVFQIERP